MLKNLKADGGGHGTRGHLKKNKRERLDCVETGDRLIEVTGSQER